MSRNFKVYRDSAQDVEHGWTQRSYSSPDGTRVCGVKAVLNASHTTGTRLPQELVDEIDSHLQQYWYYRFLKARRLFTGNNTQCAIEHWNDSIWRRKQQVVDVFNNLASELELKWLRDEHIRLTAEVARLQLEIKKIKVHVGELEEKTRHFRRLTNTFPLRSDRRQIEELEEDLSLYWEQLTSLPEIATA
jgi:hypothetical protein